MIFYSTRDSDKKTKYSLTTALSQGLAHDGGLLIPNKIPKILIKDLEKLKYSELAFKVLHPFFEGSSLELELKNICDEAFNFPIEIKELDTNLSILELFHGPTLAFKDFGARFLAQCLSHMERKFQILTATSGDTGGAVAAAFHGLSNIDVFILYPENGVSEGQRAQLNFWKDNIKPFAYKGSFDDCQQNVKEAILYFSKMKGIPPSSANSINIGRLLGQITYYAFTSLKKPNSNYIIPSGNMGNSLACLWAKEMGFPIGDVVLSCNKNSSVKYFLESGELKKFDTIETLANAMDVGLPSNLERLSKLYSIDLIQKELKCTNTEDEDIKKTILKYYRNYKYLVDPHTACGLNAYDIMNIKNAIVVSTAHPIKFPKVFKELGLEDKLSTPDIFKRCLDSKYQEEKLDSFESFIKRIKN